MGDVAKDRELYKITFERVKDGKQAYFFINGICGILEQELFNCKIKEAKTGEQYSLKEKILQQLNKNE